MRQSEKMSRRWARCTSSRILSLLRRNELLFYLWMNRQETERWRQFRLEWDEKQNEKSHLDRIHRNSETTPLTSAIFRNFISQKIISRNSKFNVKLDNLLLILPWCRFITLRISKGRGDQEGLRISLKSPRNWYPHSLQVTNSLFPIQFRRRKVMMMLILKFSSFKAQKGRPYHGQNQTKFCEWTWVELCFCYYIFYFESLIRISL